tara:strand:- start:1010 stop:1351 length:342 start_codon:yes stop_codon:yes gene_type:complete
MLVFLKQNLLRAIDFDDSFFVKLGFDVAGRRACFFVNLLLLSVHIRTAWPHDFVDTFASIVGKVLMDLWKECLEDEPSFGAGASWIKSTTIAQSAIDGKFDRDRIANLPSKEV